MFTYLLLSDLKKKYEKYEKQQQNFNEFRKNNFSNLKDSDLKKKPHMNAFISQLCFFLE